MKINQIFWDRTVPVFFIILNVILKIIHVTANSLARDEPFSVYHAQMDVGSIIYHLKHGNNPPLYEIFLHYWIHFFGISEFSVRMPSVIFSSLTVFFIYRIGRDFFNFRVGVFAAILFTLSNFHISVAHEARVYSLFCLLVTVSMHLFMQVTEKQKVKRYLIWLLFINILLIYSHYLGFVVLILQSVIIIVVRSYRIAIFKIYLYYLTALIILYIPNIKILLMRFMYTSENGTWVQQPDGIDSLYSILVKFMNMPAVAVIGLTILGFALIKSLIKKDINNRNIVVINWFLVPFLGLFWLSYSIPMLVDKYLVFVSPALYLLLAIASIYILENKKVWFFIPLSIAILFCVTCRTSVSNNREVEVAIDKVFELQGENDMIIISPKHFMLNFAYYYNRSVFENVDSERIYAKMDDTFRSQNIYSTNTATLPFGTAEKIIYFDAGADFSFPDNHLMDSLNRHYHIHSVYPFPEIFRVHVFSTW